ncbi:PHD finger family protein, putative isoform 2 [Hibiscus syriacus]|uniref:PHD finger family protein, putative isoform 2 n=1 Tax=Hibiscus syriacus TaxID=106335 RepID=A0A6A3AIJ9_HIBSY|nr:PHD finger family protein, putative isoform 2 [Hibiscus syriacus]
MTGALYHQQKKKMMGRGADRGCGTKERPCSPISRVSSRSPVTQPETSGKQYDIVVDFFSQARKELSQRSPFDIPEGGSVAGLSLPTLPSGLASLLKQIDSRKRHKKSHSGADKKSSKQGEKAREASIWVETEEYFRDLTLSDIDALSNITPFRSLTARKKCFMIPYVGNEPAGDLNLDAEVDDKVSVSSGGENSNVRNENGNICEEGIGKEVFRVEDGQLMEIDSGATQAQFSLKEAEVNHGSVMVKPCVLCPKQGGVLKPIQKNDGNDASVEFAHLFCSQWMPEAGKCISISMPNVDGIWEKNLSRLGVSISTHILFLDNFLKSNSINTFEVPIVLYCHVLSCGKSVVQQMELAEPHSILYVQEKPGIEWKFGEDMGVIMQIELRAFCSKHSEIHDNSHSPPLGELCASGTDSSITNQLPLQSMDKSQNSKVSLSNGDKIAVDIEAPDTRSSAQVASECGETQQLGDLGLLGKSNDDVHNPFNSLNFAMILKKLIDRGKVNVKDVALEIGLSSDYLRASLNVIPNDSLAPDLRCKIVKWLSNHAYIVSSQKNLKVNIKSLISSKDESKATHISDDIMVSKSDMVDLAAVKPMPPRRTKNNVKNLRDNKVICSDEIIDDIGVVMDEASCDLLAKEETNDSSKASILGTTGKKRVHWVNWSTVCQPLDGGLGVLDLSKVVSLQDSWVWRGIRSNYEKKDEIGDCLRSNSKIQVGNGRSIDFWNDIWVNGSTLKIQFPRIYALLTNKRGKLVEFGGFVANGWVWNIQLRRNLCDWELDQWLSLMLLIDNITPNESVDDFLGWSGKGDGLFSVKSCRMTISSRTGGHSQWKKWVWSGLTPPRVETFLWQFTHQKLAVRVELKKRGVNLEDVLCPFCHKYEESIHHLFFSCSVAEELWYRFLRFWDISSVMPQDPPSFLCSWSYLRECSNIWKFIPGVVLWSIWKARNAVVFENWTLDNSSLFFISRFRLAKWFLAKFPHVNIQVDLLVGDPSLADNLPIKSYNKEKVLNWSSPPSNFFKFNVDGAVRGDGLQGVELKAIKQGIDLFISSEWALKGRLILETDCKTAVDWILMPVSAPTFFNTLVGEIEALVSARGIIVRWIPRTCNWEANKLAKEGTEPTAFGGTGAVETGKLSQVRASGAFLKRRKHESASRLRKACALALHLVPRIQGPFAPWCVVRCLKLRSCLPLNSANPDGYKDPLKGHFHKSEGISTDLLNDGLYGRSQSERAMTPEKKEDQGNSICPIINPVIANLIRTEEFSNFYIHPYTRKQMLQIHHGMLCKNKVGASERDLSCLVASSNASVCCSHQIDNLKCKEKSCQSDDLVLSVKAGKLGAIEFSPEDEVEGEIIYYQHRLLGNAVARNHVTDNLVSRVAKSLPREVETARTKIWDIVLVNQYLYELREAKKQGRKERRYQEAQAVLAAANAAVAASSRISSSRKDGLEDSSHQENVLKPNGSFRRSGINSQTREKDTIFSRNAVPRISSEKYSDSVQSLTDFSKGHPRSCDICRRSETILNPILVCSGCKVAVHLDCYRNVKESTGRWHCELCEELFSSIPSGAPSLNFWEKPYPAVECGLCGGTTGAFRKSVDGQWVHAFCAEWVFESTFRRGQVTPVEGMEIASRGIDVCCICGCKNGACIKCSYGHCQITFHPSCARSAGFCMNVQLGGGKLHHKAYCEQHSGEQRAEAETQKHGIEELKNMKQIRVELERLRLLCERIIKREKLKRELVLFSHEILACKREHATRSVLIHSPFFHPDVSSESATTYLKGHTDDNKSCSEAMRSDDVTVDSTLSVKRQAKVPVPVDNSQRTDGSSTSQSLFVRKPTERVPFSGKQIPHRYSLASRNALVNAEWNLKSRKPIETFEKELVMTSDEASMKNSRLPKGYCYVPVDCLPKEKQLPQDASSDGQSEHNG